MTDQEHEDRRFILYCAMMAGRLSATTHEGTLFATLEAANNCAVHVDEVYKRFQQRKELYGGNIED